MWDIKKLRDLDKDDLLNLIGLQSKRTVAEWLLPTVGIFGVGLLIGAGVGLLLAPKPGKELRGELRSRIQEATDQLSENFSNAQTQTRAPTPTPTRSEGNQPRSEGNQPPQRTTS
ncbi:MAG TPA: YtxH domain-containing protein [Myxococcales bacterium]